jgi:hypothetical protein
LCSNDIERHGRFTTPLDEGGEGFDHDRVAHLVDLVAFAEALVGEQVVLADDAQQVSRVITRWRITSMRSSAKLVLLVDTSSGEICCDSTRMVPVDW